MQSDIVPGLFSPTLGEQDSEAEKCPKKSNMIVAAFLRPR
jgi:hypothetical protein